MKRGWRKAERKVLGAGHRLAFDRRWRLGILTIFLLLAGCGPSDQATQSQAGKRLLGVKLRLVVVDDPAIAGAVRGLRDEWNAQTGSELEVIETSEKQIADAGTLPGDAAISPDHLLGPLAEAKRLAPVPRSIAGDPNDPWSQSFELLRNQEAVWGNEVYGVPLGAGVLLLLSGRLAGEAASQAAPDLERI